MSRRRRRARRAVTILLAALLLAPVAASAVVWLGAPLPMWRLEQWPASPLVTDRHGVVMLELVGPDQQWRHPVPLAAMSPWLLEATIAVEDERFRRHPGVDPAAVARAAWQNARAGRVVSGASTITMQICRMLDERPRTLVAKLVEAVRALQLERRLGKDEILQAYLNIAPYGGNRRGVEAASRAYFGKAAADLSLAEAALLAGLPQSPERLRPDRHPAAALERRDTVLRRMREEGLIDEAQRRRAAAAPLPLQTTTRRPRAPHAAWAALARRPDGGRTTIDLDLQEHVERLVAGHAQRLPRSADIGVVVLRIEDGDIVAMVGSADHSDPVDGQVNAVLARRSPGSTLKPFVYAAAFAARRLSPDSIVHDVPIRPGGWAPANFDGAFRGEVTVAEALQRSLNVPAIHVASQLGLPRCAGTIESAGIALAPDVVERAGLSLAVGGVEVSLLELTNAYATIGRRGVFRRARLFLDEDAAARPALGREVCAALDAILSSRARRPAGLEALRSEDVPWFAWKTGTSSGRRDAWAVGHNRGYAIGVWAGRFDGGGDEAFVGARAAEPLLAALFALPALRGGDAPAAPEPWTVHAPLAPPAVLSSRLSILSPADGASFLPIDGRAVVHVAANREHRLHWFLDGAHLDGDGALRLELAPGSYELRCVDDAGRSAASRFRVGAVLRSAPVGR